MAAKPMDALTSFQHVVDSVNQWKTSVSELAVYVSTQHDMYVAEYSRLLDQAKGKKRKSDSIVSIHSNDEYITPLKDVAVLKSPNPSEFVNISPFEAGNRFIYAQAHRKRKPGTSIRSNGSETVKHRSKDMVVIYYNSHIQSELDRLVKSLGTARNNLRKGKNAYTAAKGFGLPTLNRRLETTPRVNSNPSKSTALPSKSRNGNPQSLPEPMTVDAAFPSTDKELEAIQSLCETAAHQILRDGDCRIELQSALDKISTIFTLADTAISLLRTEHSQDEPLLEPLGSSNASGQTSTVSTLCEKPSSEVINAYPKTMAPTIESLTVQKSSPKAEPYCLPTVLAADADAIEVDDASSDDLTDIDIDITNFRAAGRLRLVT